MSHLMIEAPTRLLDEKIARQIVAYERAQNPAADVEFLEQIVLALSVALGRGQSCLPVDQETEQRLLNYAVLCQTPRQYQNQPLVLNRNKLYLARYYFYEDNLLQHIQQRLNTPLIAHLASLPQVLAHLFPYETLPIEPDWQKVAAASACLQNFCIITGGPGTGKTTTVTKLLSALLELHPNLHIALAAPTGKASARMTESIRGAKRANAELLNKDKIPEKSFTLHRLLGWSPRGFRYHAGQYLPYDCVVVDEASMIDLPMMSHLISALAPSARLILLGDQDQLASVEVGSVLADLCNVEADKGPDQTFASMLQEVTGFDLSHVIQPKTSGLQNAVAQLRHSYRFHAKSGIGHLARAVNQGEQNSAERCFIEFPHELQWLTLEHNAQRLQDHFEWCSLIEAGFAPFVHAVKGFQQHNKVAEVFAALNQFQVLVAQRKGSLGVENINQLIAQQLKPKLPLNTGGAELSQWYCGRVVMISENNYDLNLFNGDVGICLPHEGTLRVVFESSEGSVRWLLPSRLPAHEAAFAMTVHKSQGSEFSHVVFVLPTEHSPIITKELIYTAITRAKNKFTLFSNPSCWEQGLQAKVQRASGLRDALWGEPSL